MADGQNKAALIIGEEEYELNQRRIEEARRYIDNWDAMNEQAKKEYDRMQEDLQKKIREGQEASRMLKAMQEQQATRKQQLAIAGPSGQHVPQVTNPRRTDPPFPANAPVATSRIEEIPQANHVVQQPNPTKTSYGPSSSNQKPTSTQTWAYPSGAVQQAYSSNWTPYPASQNRHPTQPGPVVMAGAPPNVSQSVPPLRYGYGQPVHTQYQQQTQTHREQSLHTMPAQGSSSGMQQGPYQIAQTSVVHLPLKQQQGTIPTHVRQQENTYSGRHQPSPQYTTPQSTINHSPYPHPTVTTVAAPQPIRQSNSGQHQRPNSQAKAPAHAALFAQTSSSLVGALGGTNKASTVTSSNGINRSQPVPSSSNAEALTQQRSALSKPQTTFATGPIVAPSPATIALNPSEPSQAIPGSAASMFRLKTLIYNWEREGPPQSYFELTGAKIKFYKDKTSKIYLVTPDKKGGYAYIGVSGLDEAFRTISQEVLKTKATANPNAAERVQVSEGPLTAEEATVNGPHGELSKRSSAPAVISLGEPQPLESSNRTPALPMRTPKDADKAHLARDILRALTQKRPRPDSVTISSQEPSAKRHAPDVRAEVTVGGAIPNTTTNLSIPSSSIPLPPQPVLPPPSQPLNSSSTLPSSHSQSTFRVTQQAPTFAPPLTGVLNLTTSTNGVSPLPSTGDTNGASPLPPIGNTNNPVSVSRRATVSPFLPPMEPPSTKDKQPLASNTNTIPNISKSRTPQPEPAVNPSPPFVADLMSDIGREKTPLFLPSPSPSPSLQAVRGDSVKLYDGLATNTRDDISAYSKVVDSGGTGKRKRQLCYVLVPPLPKYVQRFKAKQRTSIKEDTVWHTSVPASDGFVTDNIQSEAVQLSCSRLTKRPCRLGGCEAVLNSTQALLDHISQEHKPKRARCQWPQCGRQLQDSKVMFYHIRGHALIPLECAYQDCQESFRTPQQLVRHHEAIHRNSNLKPSAAFFTPELSPPPAAPESLPAYMVEARQVRPPSISKDRHHMLGPWVLRNISGPVNLKTKRYNAAQPLRSQNREQMERRPGNQPYDFITYPSTIFSTTSSQPAKLPRLDDLPSAVVSEMTYDGMVLWQAPEVKVEKPAVEIVTAESRATTDELTLPGGLNQMPGTRGPLSRGDNHSDEEAVENMLAE